MLTIDDLYNELGTPQKIAQGFESKTDMKKIWKNVAKYRKAKIICLISAIFALVAVAIAFAVVASNDNYHSSIHSGSTIEEITSRKWLRSLEMPPCVTVTGCARWHLLFILFAIRQKQISYFLSYNVLTGDFRSPNFCRILHCWGISDSPIFVVLSIYNYLKKRMFGEKLLIQLVFQGRRQLASWKIFCNTNGLMTRSSHPKKSQTPSTGWPAVLLTNWSVSICLCRSIIYLRKKNIRFKTNTFSKP